MKPYKVEITQQDSSFFGMFQTKSGLQYGIKVKCITNTNYNIEQKKKHLLNGYPNASEFLSGLSLVDYVFYDVMFMTDNTDGFQETNEGDALRVLATVVDFITKIASSNKNAVCAFMFSSTKTANEIKESDNKKPLIRTRIYNHYIAKNPVPGFVRCVNMENPNEIMVASVNTAFKPGLFRKLQALSPQFYFIVDYLKKLIQ